MCVQSLMQKQLILCLCDISVTSAHTAMAQVKQQLKNLFLINSMKVQCDFSSFSASGVHFCALLGTLLLGGSGGVVNSLDFCPTSLKSFGCFYFQCVLTSQWKAVTVNLRILHCQL